MLIPGPPTGHAGRLLLCLILPVLLGACASSSRILKPSAAEADLAPSLHARADDGVELMLHRVIVRNDGASWVRDADWDEYVLSVRSDAAAPVQLRSIELASELVADGKHTVVPNELKSQTARNAEGMKTAGRIFVIGYAGVATGGVLALSSLGYTVVTPLLPIAVLVAGVSAYRSQSQANADAAVIEYELGRRGFQVPAALAPGSRLQSSAFFPVTPAPKSLLLRYEVGGVERDLVLDLGRYSQLHLEPGARAAATAPMQAPVAAR